MTTNTLFAQVFGDGCDARIAGYSLADNPYPFPSEDATLRVAWATGWRHCDQYYGVDAKRPVRQLPPLKETTYVGIAVEQATQGERDDASHLRDVRSDIRCQK